MTSLMWSSTIDLCYLFQHLFSLLPFFFCSLAFAFAASDCDFDFSLRSVHTNRITQVSPFPHHNVFYVLCTQRNQNKLFRLSHIFLRFAAAIVAGGCCASLAYLQLAAAAARGGHRVLRTRYDTQRWACARQKCPIMEKHCMSFCVHALMERLWFLSFPLIICPLLTRSHRRGEQGLQQAASVRSL